MVQRLNFELSRVQLPPEVVETMDDIDKYDEPLPPWLVNTH
jgi:hypothetical protein